MSTLVTQAKKSHSCSLNLDILLGAFDVVKVPFESVGLSMKLIKAQLVDTSPDALLNVALTCKTFYELSKTLIYRNVHLTFNRNRRMINGSLIRRLLEDNSLSKNVRCVRIRWAPNASLQSGEGSKEDLALLGQALPKLVGLHTFVWDAQYPIVSWLLDVLRSSHPECMMYIRHPPNQDAARTLSRLRDLPKLHALDASFLGGQLLAYHELGQLLMSSSIRDLAITSPGEQQAILQVLWDLPGPLHLRSLDIDGIMVHLADLPIAWSRVTSLRISTGADWFGRLPQFRDLRSLELRFYIDSCESSLDQFLKVVKGLKSCL